MAKVISFGRCLLVAAVMAGSMACMHSALAADGYDGVVATPPDDKGAPNNAPAGADNGPTPGYNGVVADPSAPTPAESADQYTPVPGRAAPVTDLRTAALINGAPLIKAPSVDFSATRHNLIAGKSAAEYMVSRQVAQAMASINNKNLPDDERAANAKSAYQSLSALADGLRSKQAIPDDTYKSLGLTDTYINDERNGNDAALTQLDAALSTLKSSQ